MRFYDEVVQAPNISAEVKALLEDCVVINATNVGEYYFQGTDKEYWNFQDFPNVAPPFGRFWLDFDAPEYCISRETGTLKWSKEMVSRWGVHCQGESISQHMDRLKSIEGREEIRVDLADIVCSTRDALIQQIPNLVTIARQGEEYARSHLSPENFTALSYILKLYEQLDKIESGNWQDFVFPISYKWRMDVTVFRKIFRSGRNVVDGPLWTWRLYIADDGSVLHDPVTGVLLNLTTPLGDMYRSFERLRENGMDYLDAWYKMRDTVYPFFHTGMLAISFMHCKNVVTTDVVPERRVLRNKGAKRRGASSPYQPVAYKTIDIQPMRRVLKNVENGLEGSTDRTARAFHICRGHFADYTEHPLFGKHYGTFWIPQHTRGDLPANARDYRIRL